MPENVRNHNSGSLKVQIFQESIPHNPHRRVTVLLCDTPYLLGKHNLVHPPLSSGRIPPKLSNDSPDI